MPIFDSTHASASQPPVTCAMRGISPSARFFGRRNVPSVICVSPHIAADGTVSLRRHLPVVMMTGMLVPGGTSSLKLPSASDCVIEYAPPGMPPAHVPHCTPSGNGGGSVIGTYTITLQNGRVPL